jgi:hypothetical protein
VSSGVGAGVVLRLFVQFGVKLLEVAVAGSHVMAEYRICFALRMSSLAPCRCEQRAQGRGCTHHGVRLVVVERACDNHMA